MHTDNNSALKAQDSIKKTRVEPTDAEIELLLVEADIAKGTGETADEVVEHLDELRAPDDEPPKAVAPAVVDPPGELDTAGEQIVEGFIAVAEAYENQTDKPATAPIAEMRRWRERTLASDCKEFGIDPTDPMAEQKLRVARHLKPFKLTLADLEAHCPEFWSLPLKTVPKEGKKSRAWVLKTFTWRGYDGVTAPARTKLEDDKRLKKRAAKIAAKGWRVDYDKLSPADKKRERDKVWHQNERNV